MDFFFISFSIGGSCWNFCVPNRAHIAQRREAVARTRAAAPTWRAVAAFCFFWSLRILPLVQATLLLAASFENLFWLSALQAAETWKVVSSAKATKAALGDAARGLDQEVVAIAGVAPALF